MFQSLKALRHLVRPLLFAPSETLGDHIEGELYGTPAR
jgi:hypothetical protein